MNCQICVVILVVCVRNCPTSNRQFGYLSAKQMDVSYQSQRSNGQRILWWRKRTVSNINVLFVYLFTCSVSRAFCFSSSLLQLTHFVLSSCLHCCYSTVLFVCVSACIPLSAMQYFFPLVYFLSIASVLFCRQRWRSSPPTPPSPHYFYFCICVFH